jgi:hypothetical protein
MLLLLLLTLLLKQLTIDLLLLLLLLLLQAGAKAAAVDNRGDTAIDIARRLGNCLTATLLQRAIKPPLPR